MTFPMELKVLADSSQEKGSAFERLMGLILDKLGYTDIRRKVHSIGMELDIEARHKVTGRPVLCECKAHVDEIGTDELKKFLGSLAHERSIHKDELGMFFSLSGFNGTARRWYDELDVAHKEFFKIFDNSGIFELLKEADVIIDDQEIKTIIEKNTDNELGQRYLVYFGSDLYVVQLLLVAGVPHRYIVLRSRGSLVGKEIIDAISKLDESLNSLQVIDLQIEDKVIISLLGLRERTSKDITEEITETAEDVAVVLDELKREGIVEQLDWTNRDQLFLIRRDIVAVSKLVKKFLDADNERRQEFMLSAYVNNISDSLLANYVADRFKIDFDTPQRLGISNAAKVFPSAFYWLFFGKTERYITFYEELNRLQLPTEKSGQLRQVNLHIFMNELLMNVYRDLSDLSAEYLEKKGIAGYHWNQRFSIASESVLFFSINSEGVYHIASKDKGDEISAGQILSSTNVSGQLRLASLHIALRLFNDAIEIYDIIIRDEPNNGQILKVAWNNKGVCYLRTNRCEEAIPCFEKALSYDNKLVEALDNQLYCYKAMNRPDDVQRIIKMVEKIKQES